MLHNILGHDADCDFAMQTVWCFILLHAFHAANVMFDLPTEGQVSNLLNYVVKWNAQTCAQNDL